MLAHNMCHIAQQSDNRKVPYLQLCAAIISKKSLVQIMGCDLSLSVVHLILFQTPKPSICYFTVNREPKGNEISIKIRSNYSIHMHFVI